MYICEEKAKDMKKRITLASIIAVIIATMSSCAGDIGKLSPETDYLAYVITESNHPALEAGVHVYMMRNKDKDCYYYRKSQGNPQELELICSGSYDVDVNIEFSDEVLSEATATPFIVFSYPSDEDERFTDNSTPPTAHRLMFDINHVDTKLEEVLSRFNFYLGINWDALVEKALQNKDPNKTKVLSSPTLRTKVAGTSYVITGEVAISPAPPALQ